MKIRYIMASLVLVWSSSVYADSKFDGFYLGVETQGNYNKTEILWNDYNSNNFSLGFFGGYGFSFDKFYLGAEGNALWDLTKTKYGDISYRKDFGYGVNARLGYMITPDFMGYGILGLDRKNISFENPIIPTSTSTLNGLRFGGGIQQYITNNLSLKTELSVTNWQKYDLMNVFPLNSYDINAKVGVSYSF